MDLSRRHLVAAEVSSACVVTYFDTVPRIGDN